MSRADPPGPQAATTAAAASAADTALRHCLQDAPDGIVLLDRDARVVFGNGKACELLGIGASAAPLALPELLTPEERERWLQYPPAPLLLAAQARPRRLDLGARIRSRRTQQVFGARQQFMEAVAHPFAVQSHFGALVLSVHGRSL